MALWGAVGLSLLPGCRRSAGGPSSATGTWAELGRVWRELSAHSRGKYGREEGEAKLKALEADMASALAELPAWAELSTLFEERAAHIQRERYFLATCYEMSSRNPMRAREDVEKQMTALQKLVEERRLTKEAAEKAAQAVAADAEYLTQLNVMYKGGKAARAKFEPIYEAYEAGKLKPGEGAERAGRHVVGLEVDKPGLLIDADEAAKESAP